MRSEQALFCAAASLWLSLASVWLAGAWCCEGLSSVLMREELMLNLRPNGCHSHTEITVGRGQNRTCLRLREIPCVYFLVFIYQLYIYSCVFHPRSCLLGQEGDL